MPKSMLIHLSSEHTVFNKISTGWHISTIAQHRLHSPCSHNTASQANLGLVFFVLHRYHYDISILDIKQVIHDTCMFLFPFCNLVWLKQKRRTNNQNQAIMFVLSCFWKITISFLLLLLLLLFYCMVETSFHTNFLALSKEWKREPWTAPKNALDHTWRHCFPLSSCTPWPHKWVRAGM